MESQRAAVLLALIEFCQSRGSVLLAEVLFAYLLDKIMRGGMPDRTSVIVADQIGDANGAHIVVRYDRIDKSMPMARFSPKFRERLAERFGLEAPPRPDPVTNVPVDVAARLAQVFTNPKHCRQITKWGPEYLSEAPDDEDLAAVLEFFDPGRA